MNSQIKTVLVDFQKSLEALQENFKQDLNGIVKKTMQEVEALSQKEEGSALSGMEKELENA